MIKKGIHNKKKKMKKKKYTFGTNYAVAPIPSLKIDTNAFTQLTSLQILSN